MLQALQGPWVGPALSSLPGGPVTGTSFLADRAPCEVNTQGLAAKSKPQHANSKASNQVQALPG